MRVEWQDLVESFFHFAGFIACTQMYEDERS